MGNDEGSVMRTGSFEGKDTQTLHHLPRLEVHLCKRFSELNRPIPRDLTATIIAKARQVVDGIN
jgi:hypothetical protein